MSRELYLQEGHEVLLHQVVAAGAHEQVDEPGGGVVTVLQDPGSTEGVRVCSRTGGHRACCSLGPRLGRTGREGEGAAEGPSGCPRRARPAPATQDSLPPHGDELVDGDGAGALPAGSTEEGPLPVEGAAAGLRGVRGGVSAIGHPLPAPPPRGPLRRSKRTLLWEDRGPPQAGGDTGLSGCPARCRRMVRAAGTDHAPSGTRSVGNGNGQVPNCGNEAASEHPWVG